MSYPPATYTADHGEVSATYRPVDSAPELTYSSGNTVRYLSTGASTNGQFGLYRWEIGPERSGPEPHFHRSISESFFILAGSMRVYDGTRWIDTVPGDYVHVPACGIHGYRNESGAPASMLLHFAPGAPREGYFEGLPGLADMTDEERAAFFLQHDSFWLD